MTATPHPKQHGGKQATKERGAGAPKTKNGTHPPTSTPTRQRAPTTTCVLKTGPTTQRGKATHPQRRQHHRHKDKTGGHTTPLSSLPQRARARGPREQRPPTAVRTEEHPERP